MAMSADGRYQVRSFMSNLVVSTDYGMTWQVKRDFSFEDSVLSVCISGDAKFQLVCCSGRSYMSDDFGLTWKKLDVTGSSYSFITMNK